MVSLTTTGTDDNGNVTGYVIQIGADFPGRCMHATEDGGTDVLPLPPSFKRRLTHELGHAADHHDPGSGRSPEDNLKLENKIMDPIEHKTRTDLIPCDCDI